MVDSLESNGYVTRKTHPTDKRGKIIVLTERGLSVKVKEEIVAEIEQRWIENIGIERMQILKEDLTTFVTKENTEKLSSNIRPVRNKNESILIHLQNGFVSTDVLKIINFFKFYSTEYIFTRYIIP